MNFSKLFFLERVPSVGIAYLKEQPELTKKFPAFVEWGNLLCKASKNKRMTIDWGHIFDSIQAEVLFAILYFYKSVYLSFA